MQCGDAAKRSCRPRDFGAGLGTTKPQPDREERGLRKGPAVPVRIGKHLRPLSHLSRHPPPWRSNHRPDCGSVACMMRPELLHLQDSPKPATPPNSACDFRSLHIIKNDSAPQDPRAAQSIPINLSAQPVSHGRHHSTPTDRRSFRHLDPLDRPARRTILAKHPAPHHGVQQVVETPILTVSDWNLGFHSMV